MHKQAHLVPSQAMERKMYLWQYGTYGWPLLVFPSASGMAHEWEKNGMTDALADLIDGGKLKLYCIESNVSEAWTRGDADGYSRIQRHMAYERFIVQELVPLIREDCRTQDIPIAVSGTSMGAYYSANFALKFPEIFRYALCLSGRYDIRKFNDLDHQDAYFNNPLAYAWNLGGEHLERIRNNTHLALVCGRGKWEDGNYQETEALANLLKQKGVSCELDLWGQDVSHQWEWWVKQAQLHLGRRYSG